MSSLSFDIITALLKSPWNVTQEFSSMVSMPSFVVKQTMVITFSAYCLKAQIQHFFNGRLGDSGLFKISFSKITTVSAVSTSWWIEWSCELLPAFWLVRNAGIIHVHILIKIFEALVGWTKIQNRILSKEMLCAESRKLKSMNINLETEQIQVPQTHLAW